jgi:hypothetical protein
MQMDLLVTKTIARVQQDFSAFATQQEHLPKPEQFRFKCGFTAQRVFDILAGEGGAWSSSSNIDWANATGDAIQSRVMIRDHEALAIYVHMDGGIISGGGHRFCILGAVDGKFEIFESNADSNMKYLRGELHVYALGDRPRVTMTATDFEIWWVKLWTAVNNENATTAGNLIGVESIDVKPESCFIKIAPVLV